MTEKANDAYRTISEVGEELDLPQHVLRFWETRFGHIKPLKRAGGRRYYRPDDVALLRGIRELLYGRGYTIRGVQKILREQGVRRVQDIGNGAPVEPPTPETTAEIAGDPHPEVAATPAAGASSAVPGEIMTRLRAIAAELAECRRQIAVARRS